MKRKVNKGKIALFSALGLSAVALTSVGLATWIAGVQVTTDSAYATLSVDTVSNKSEFLEVNIAESTQMKVAEVASKSNDADSPWYTDYTDTTPSNLMKVSFTAKLLVGEGLVKENTTADGTTYTTTPNLKKLSVDSISFAKSDKTSANSPSYSNGAISYSTKLGTATSDTSYSLLKLSATSFEVTWSGDKKSSTSGYYEFSYSGTLTFTFGDAYKVGEDTSATYSPCYWANNDYKTNKSGKDNAGLAALLNTEAERIEMLHTALDGLTMTVGFKIEASTTTTSAS